jgi:hypothetical protein
MAVTKEMVLVRLEDVAPFAEARELARLARAFAGAARHADHRVLTADLARTALAVVATIADGLRAGDPREELRRYRQAQLALHELRAQAYDALVVCALADDDFDALMAGSARTLREVEAAITAARQRARRRLDFDE